MNKETLERIPGVSGLLPLVVAGAVLAAVVIPHDAPLKSSRPSPRGSNGFPEPPSSPAVSSTHARLWEDPLLSAQRIKGSSTAAEKADVSGFLGPMLQSSRPGNPNGHLGRHFSSLANRSGENFRVLPVFMQGGPYVSSSEDRMRIRYALLSALSASGYVLSFGERMTAFTIHDLKVTPLPKRKPIKIDLVVPVKLYKKITKQRPEPEFALVLWINESQLGVKPLDVLCQILTILFGDIIPKKLAIIGPTSSDMLQVMIEESKKALESDLNRYKTTLGHGKLFSARSTAIIDGFKTNNRLTCDLELVRSIGTDEVLAKALKRELGLRKAWPLRGSTRRHVVIITERDTLYGRNFPKLLKESISRTECFHRFTYLRGIDGQHPGRERERAGASRATSDTEIESAAKEVPAGTSQFDYLRRLASELQHLQYKLREKGAEEITAIGITGTDIFDKLLILRALRNRFPKVCFFTTDLDARFWHSKEYEYTRNVVVASHFNIGLNGRLRFDVVPFRDSYQTGMFLGVLQAVENKTIWDLAKNCDVDPYRLWDGELKPLIFEIGRSGPYQLPQPQVGKFSQELQSQRSGQTPGSILLLVLLVLVPTLAGLYCMAPSVPIVENMLRQTGEKLKEAYEHCFSTWNVAKLKKTGQLDILATILAVPLTIAFAVLVIVDSNSVGGEPFHFFEGISIWPSVVLRYCALLLGISFIVRGRRRLKQGFEKLSAGVERFPQLSSLFTEHYGGWKRDNVRRIFLQSLIFLGVAMVLFMGTDKLPGTPHRGSLAFWVTFSVTMTAVFTMLLVSFFVAEAMTVTRSILHRWSDSNSLTQETRGSEGGTGHEGMHPALGLIRLVGEQTTVVGNLVYYPFILLFLMACSRLPVFDNWDVTWPLLAVMTVLFLLPILGAATMRRAAGNLRRTLLEALGDDLELAVKENNEAKSKYLEHVITEAARVRRGAYRPIMEDPVLTAVSIPFGGTGTLILIERFVNLM